ncbi:hypothetical protein CRG98_046233 [Punica granatum]|uniref:Uncharacterized protein n=1 Tax=Punica granatum TaxID=22663 RepID=A0A2I0HNQ9_PUNGR|nr:hypothetical protein CRG98_046233 [Punica granatum]
MGSPGKWGQGAFSETVWEDGSRASADLLAYPTTLTLIQQFVNFKMKHIYREANTIAGHLARLARDDLFDFDSIVYFDCPFTR